MFQEVGRKGHYARECVWMERRGGGGERDEEGEYVGRGVRKKEGAGKVFETSPRTSGGKARWSRREVVWTGGTESGMEMELAGRREQAGEEQSPEKKAEREKKRTR
ncbi:hypothetical protein DPEC_G00134170 [Dallia pectoralis]|uniref:Uncharacterized protein n=1 Tax=Dallia pectoralis TaxID=75939 RepID=A0ACC2GS78_DALPE|nr:hypothetical protein DPEC_G00134170 [Dallia pectoralis]